MNGEKKRKKVDVQLEGFVGGKGGWRGEQFLRESNHVN